MDTIPSLVTVTKKPMVLETPVSVDVSLAGGYQSQYINMYPYRTHDFRKVIAGNLIKFPFERIVDRSMGTSVCKKCKAVYAGDAYNCHRQVRVVSLATPGKDWALEKVVSESLVKGQRTLKSRWQGNEKVSLEVISVATEICHGRTEWSLQEEFDKQVSYFLLIETISGLTWEDPFEKWEHCFSEEKLRELRNRYVARHIQQIGFELDQHQQAINQIKEKMGEAGDKLSSFYR